MKKIASSLFAIFAICGLVLSGMGLNAHALSGSDSKTFSGIKSFFKVGYQQYLIKFNACTEKTVVKPTIVINTDKEIVKIPYKKTMFSGMCKSFEFRVTAKDPTKITIDVFGYKD